MAFVPNGHYLTINEYRKRYGLSRTTILHAINQKRLDGAIWLDDKTVIIPEDSIVTSKNIKSGKYIGVHAWLRGEIQHQEEVRLWNLQQDRLRKLREKDGKD